VLLNAAAVGAGKPRSVADIAELFLAAGSRARITMLQRGQDLAEAARSAGALSSIVVAGGGDGTMSGVAAGLIGTPAVLGVLPLGTLNHFAKDLRIPLDLEKAVGTIAAGRVSCIDVGTVNGRTFLNNSSIGIYPDIVEAREELRRRGHRKWSAFVLATFRVLRDYRGVLVRIDADGVQSVRRTPFVFVGNNEYAIEGSGLGGRTRLDGGRLVAYLTPRLRARDLPMLFVRALAGRARQSGEFEIVSALEVWVDTPRSRHVRVSLDGEITTMATPLHYRTCPGALKVLQPEA
jgi:diacylglycerol kinase family enzyme